MLVIGHRGACGYEPENTLLSFKKALELNVDMVEFDVRKTADDKLVIMHDSTVDRTTDGSGTISDMTLAKLRKLDAGKGQKIPTLEEVLDLVDRKVRVYIEIKAADAVQELAYTIKRYIEEKGWTANDFLVSSFDLESLQEFHTLAPDIQLMVLVSRVPKNWLSIMKKLPAEMMAVSIRSLSKELIEAAHKNNIACIVYTVNDPQEIDRIIKFGVDGICSDYPDRIKQIIS